MKLILNSYVYQEEGISQKRSIIELNILHITTIKTRDLETEFFYKPDLRGGYSHVKTYGDVPQFWVGFLQEIPKHGSHFS